MGRMRHRNYFAQLEYQLERAAQRIQAAFRRMFAIMGLQAPVVTYMDSLIAHSPPVAPTPGWNRLVARVVRYEQLRIIWRNH